MAAAGSDVLVTPPSPCSPSSLDLLVPLQTTFHLPFPVLPVYAHYALSLKTTLSLDTALLIDIAFPLSHSSRSRCAPADPLSPRRLVAPALPHLEALRLCRALCVGAQPQLEEHDVCCCVDSRQCARGGDHLGTGVLTDAFFSVGCYSYPRCSFSPSLSCSFGRFSRTRAPCPSHLNL